MRVETKTGLVRERRVLRTLANEGPHDKDELDKAMDDAYETMRILNVNLRRRYSDGMRDTSSSGGGRPG